MAQHEIAAAVGFGVASRSKRLRAGFDQGLEGVGHCVAVDRVVVPELGRQQSADLLLNEAAGMDDARVEAAVVAYLQGKAGGYYFVTKRFTLRNGDAHRLFDQDMLAGPQRLQSQLYMELVGNRHDHRIDAGIGQHIGVASETALGAVYPGHTRQKVGRSLA